MCPTQYLNDIHPSERSVLNTISNITSKQDTFQLDAHQTDIETSRGWVDVKGRLFHQTHRRGRNYHDHRKSDLTVRKVHFH